MLMNTPLTVFYDGTCGVCSTEMSYYKTIADSKVRFVDIAGPDFAPENYGKSIEEFQKELHVCDKDGRFYTGVEAFRMLWSTLPSPFYPLLSKVTGLPLINLASRCGYSVFARFRHLLPAKNPESCKLPPSRKEH